MTTVGHYPAAMQPVIGITTRPQIVKSSGGMIPSQLVTHTYIDSVTRSGGVPVLLVPTETAHIPALLDGVDGIVLTGGGDIDPQHYGAQQTAESRGIDAARDTFELALARLTFERRIPTFAICRGHQVMNVALGGTLLRDLSVTRATEGHDEWGEAVYEPHATVTVEASSHIAEVIGPGRHSINSIHHQAIDQLGDGLNVVATSPDGTIEAVEHSDEGWAFTSVQWHPEYLDDRGHAESRALFSDFVEAAGKFAANP